MPPEPGVVPGSRGFSLATFNLGNLFDYLDDPLTEDTVLTAAEYQRRLEKRALAIHDILAEPDILVVQEAENKSVLQALVNRPEIEADYGIVWEDSPDPRGLDITVLYRHDRAVVLGYQARQGCSGLVDGLGPDGNGDVENPANTITCDRDGDGNLDGSRLFSRPPLVVELRIAISSTGVASPVQTIDVTVVANHWKSRLEDTNEVQYTLPRRIQQAEFTAALVQELHMQNKTDVILMAGDLNDAPGSEPLSILKSSGVWDLTQQIERSSRYSLVFRGVSQLIDYLMEMPASGLAAVHAQVLHINADYPAALAGVDGIVYRSSDHDPLWVNIIPLHVRIHLPVIFCGEQTG
jgi:hypothetical protein